MSSQIVRRFAAASLLAATAAACGGSTNPVAPTIASVAGQPSGTSVTTAPSTSVRALTATGTAPQVYPGKNPTCSDLAAVYAPGAEWLEAKLDSPGTGSATVTDNVINVSVSNLTANGFSWTSNIAVDAVLLKAGTENHNVYLYGPEASSDTGLVTADKYAISHITVCYDVELVVSKTAATTFTRDFDWSIAKSVNQPSVSLQDAGSATVTYTVNVARDAGTDSAWAVSGHIVVTNPHPSMTASGVSVADSLSGFGALAVHCPSSSLAPLATMTCSYAPATLPNGATRTNVATADSTTFGIVAGEGSAEVAFVTPTTVLDNAVTVSDTFAGAGIAGSIDASRVYNYSRTIGSADVACGATVTIGNTATISTDDGSPRSAAANVSASRTCAPPPPPVAAAGCTLTQGYWGTHSSFGPAKYNATWAQIGENTMFYLSGMSYYQVLQKPTGGNAYLALAHQFIAARLNVLAGAPAPAGADLAAVDAFFKTYTPAQIAALKGSSAVRQQALAWATLLDRYNNGLLNAAHCS